MATAYPSLSFLSTPSKSPISRVTYSHTIVSFTSTKKDTADSMYEVLGLSNGATCQEIKRAYRSLARVYHPDIVVVGSDRKDRSADEFMKIHAAYSTLSDPEKRADYDRWILRSKQLSASGSGFSGRVGRKWETDQCW